MGSPREQEQQSPSFDDGTRVGAYELEGFIAAGGMAEVYRARHTKLDKVVAIKFLDREHAKRADVVARFLREGRFASQIRHPNVVEVADVDEHEGQPYLVMEFLDGQHLGEYVAERGAIEPAAIAEIMLPVCAAVATAHAEGVIHRDLKPGNIFLAQTNVGEVQPKVLDFGISKSLRDDPSSALTTSASFLGTPIYLSPEQASGKDGTPHSDQYSLGVILYELATGERPYDKGQKFIRLLHSISAGRFEPPRSRRDTLDPTLEGVILRAMSLEPEGRFVSVLAMAEALMPLADDRIRAMWTPRLASMSQGDQPPPASTKRTKAPRPRPNAAEAATTLATATTVSRATLEPAPSPASASRTRMLIALGAIAGAVVLWRVVARDEVRQPQPTVQPTLTTKPAPTTFTVSVEVVPASAELLLDSRPFGAGQLQTTLPRDGSVHHLEVRADGYVPKRFSFRDAPPPSKITLDRIRPAGPAATVSASASASAPTSASASTTPPPKVSPPRPGPTPSATYSAHPDNIDPWKE